jgi:L-glyceraldehyde 3-phosphate reductase
MFSRWIETPVDGVGSLKDVLQREGVGCIVFSPLQGGLLTGRYLNDIDFHATHQSNRLSW